MYIKDTILGLTFYVNGDTQEYICMGYGDQGTAYVIGMYFDSVNNRTKLKTFKLNDVSFKGKIN